MNNEIKRVIRECCILSILHKGGLSFITATYVIFLQSKGLDLLQVNLVNAAYFTALTVCEIPTGAFADVFGRKASFIVACGIYSVSMIMYATAQNIWGYVIAEMIGAVGSTFASGAFNAWFVDRLKHHGYTGSTKPIFMKINQIVCGFGIAFAIAGSLSSKFSGSLPWVLAAVSVALCGCVACFLKEEYFVPQKFSFKSGLNSMREAVVESFHYGYRSKEVRFIMIMVSVQVLAVQAPNMQWQPFFGRQIPPELLGFVWMFVPLALMVGSFIAPKILARVVSEKRALVVAQVGTGLCLVFAALFASSPFIAFVMFALHEVHRGVFVPIKTAFLHDNIPSKSRATIESFESMANHGGGMIGLVASGIVAKHCGIPVTWIVFGLTLVLVSMIFAKNGKKM